MSFRAFAASSDPPSRSNFMFISRIHLLIGLFCVVCLLYSVVFTCSQFNNTIDGLPPMVRHEGRFEAHCLCFNLLSEGILGFSRNSGMERNTTNHAIPENRESPKKGLFSSNFARWCQAQAEDYQLQMTVTSFFTGPGARMLCNIECQGI